MCGCPPGTTMLDDDVLIRLVAPAGAVELWEIIGEGRASFDCAFSATGDSTG